MKWHKTLFAAAAAAVSLITPSLANETEPLKVLIQGGGTHHNFGQNSGIFIDAMRKDGAILADYSENPESLRYENLKEYDALLLYACDYYQHMGYEKYTPDFIPPGLEKFVEEGGGLVAVHSAIATYQDWSGFEDLIGGVWVWGTSSHDAYQVMKSEVVNPDHPIVKGIPAQFEFADEFYHTLRVHPDSRILIEGIHEKNGETVREPLAWVAKDTPEERVAVILYGHDHVSWSHDAVQTMLKQALLWSARCGE